MSSKTVLIRINRELKETLNKRFPNIPTAELMQVMYNTSALRLEGVLKEKDVKNKVGQFLYGKRWQK